MAGQSDIGYTDRVRYRLYNKNFSWATIEEPIGWNEDEKELKRSDKNFGVFTELSNNLEFVGAGYDYIKSLYLTLGIESEVILIKSVKHPVTDEWEVAYSGYLDLVTLAIKKKTLKCKFNESGFYKKILARDGEDYELTRPDTADGVIMEPLSIDKTKMIANEILLVSRLMKDTESAYGGEPLALFAYTEGWYAFPVPLTVDFAADTLVDPIIEWQMTYNSSNDSYATAQVGNIFYGIATELSTLNLDMNIKFHLDTVFGFASGAVYLDLVTFNGGDNYTFKSYENLKTVPFTQSGSGGDLSGSLDFLYDEVIDVPVGVDESLALVIRVYGALFQFYTFDKNINILIKRNSFFEATQSDVLLPHNAGNRLVEIITGAKNSFKSSFFGTTDMINPSNSSFYEQNGEGAYVGMLYGFWIRGFEKVPDLTIAEDERVYENPITTSLNDFFDSYAYTFNLGYGIETSGGKESLVVEKLEYFFTDRVLIRINDQVSNVERKPAEEFMFKSLAFGQEDGADFEEQMGLDEFNVTNKYGTYLTRTKTDLEKESPYRKDQLAIELTRRKQRESFPLEDTDNDESIFLYDMKKTDDFSEYFEAKLWQDRFAKAPTGIFAPSTAANLWLSPANCMNRFGNLIKAGLILYPDEYVRYTSSNGNSKLVTQLIGRNEVKENGIFKNSEFDRSLFVPEWITFDAPVDRELLGQVYGKTDGKPNYYGLVSFFNEDNEEEYGYLFSLKPNKQGQWKILKANK